MWVMQIGLLILFVFLSIYRLNKEVLLYNYIPFLADSNIHLVFENVTFKYLADDILIKVAGNGYYEFRNCVFMNINATASHKAVVWLNAGTALLDNCTFIECFKT